MKIGFVIYHDTTECEFVCVHECLSKVWQFGLDRRPENHVIGVTDEIVGWNGIIIRPHHHYSEVDLAEYDLLVVPGGQASRTVRYDRVFMKWLEGWDKRKPIAACCSGSLILAEAGFLTGRRATTHALAMDQLAEYPRVTVVKERVVEDDNVITAGGIMAAFDLGLYLVEKFWGAEARGTVAHQDEYRDLEAEPDTAALRERLDGWYQGGHGRVHNRPADWHAPPPALGANKKETDGKRTR